MTLIAHAGGWEASMADLQSVAIPESTDSYVPVPYGRLVEEVQLHIPRFGLKVTREDYALARGGNQMFGASRKFKIGQRAYVLAQLVQPHPVIEPQGVRAGGPMSVSVCPLAARISAYPSRS